MFRTRENKQQSHSKQELGKATSLKKILDQFYRDYDFKNRVEHDPIAIPRSFSRPEDQEVSGFVASCLAYGKVDLFMPILKEIILKMGSSPYCFLMEFKVGKQSRRFRGIKYRFSETEDILALFNAIHTVLRKNSSIQRAFKKHYRVSDQTIERGLSGVIAELAETDTSEIYGKDLKTRGFLHFLPSPKKGSACKRANLFLRWMIRDKDIDFGIWEGIPKDRLVVPLDTHVFRISRCLGLTARKSPDWKTAVEITNALKKFDPDDPVKYDFALCHQGISGLCGGMEKDEICGSCIFS